MSTLFDAADAPPRRLNLVRLAGEIARSLAPIGRIAVEGEVHEPRVRPAGTIFFTLRDRAAQISVMCPAAKARRCRAVDGERVLVTGRLVWFNDRGRLLLEAEESVPVGAGAVAAMVAEARSRLASDGLLDRRRRPIPLLPAAIGVVCGAEAAVRKDIESVVAARFAGYPVVFCEVTVSGPGAAEAIAEGLLTLDRRPDVEVIILARGGGDATELLPFSDETLCRAIATSTTPVVSAVGHEGDRPLCDEVVDLRCGTPSIAAARVVPDRAALGAELDGRLAAARLALDHRLAASGHRLAAVDFDRALDAALVRAGQRLRGASDRLALVHPSRALRTCEQRLAAHRDHLEALSPARVFERGYAVVRTRDGSVIRDAAAVGTGEVVDIQLAAGRLGARVERVERMDT